MKEKNGNWQGTWFDVTTNAPMPRRNTKESGEYANQLMLPYAGAVAMDLMCSPIERGAPKRNVVDFAEYSRRTQFFIKVLELHLEESSKFDNLRDYINFMRKR